ncbi:MAG TPA: DUF4012 domain-containing protein [Iamia sp.]
MAEVVAPRRAPALIHGEVEALVVGGLAAAAAFVAGLAGCAPTGMATTDVVLTALLAAVVTALGARATPLALGTAAVVALVAGETVPLRLAALVALVLVVPVARGVGVVPYRLDDGATLPPVPLGATAAAGLSALLTVQVVLRLPLVEPARVSAGIAAVALVPIAWSGWRRLGPTARRAGRWVVGVTVLLAVVGLATGIAAAALAATSLQDGSAASEDGLDAVRGGDQVAAEGIFRRAAADLFDARSLTRAWWSLPARHTPIVAQQVAALDAIADGGGATARLAADGAGRLDAERLRLADGRLDPAVVAEAAPILEEVADATAALHDDLAAADRRSVWQIPPVRSGIEEVTEAVGDAEGSARTGALAAELGPALLGADGEARYFVAFVSPSEARGTGFLGNYGVLTVTDGEVDLVDVGRNDELNTAGAPVKVISGPPEYLARYARFEPESTWENVTFTPDGPTAGQVMAELYEQSGGSPVDGVIRIDPTGLSRLLRITGPVTVEGLPYALDATNVVSFLEVEQYRLFEVADERTDLLGQVAEGVFDALTTGAGPAPARLAGALGPAVEGGHLSVWLRTAEGQELVERLGADGAVPEVRGDGFGVVTQNAGGGKIDVFMERTIRYDARVDAGTGAVTATAEIGLRNEAPASGEPAYLIGNLIDAPNGTNRTWLSVYSPLDLVGLAIDGQEVEVDAAVELGRNVWSVFVDIPPGAEAVVEVELAGEVDLSDGTYRWDLLPQTTVRPDRIEATVTFLGARISEAPVERAAPGGVTVDGSTVRADGGDEQGTWAFAVDVQRSG